MRKILFSLFMISAVSVAQAQVLIDDTGASAQPHSSAVLELSSDTRGLLLPRMNTAPANPAEGLVYYDMDAECFRVYSGGNWHAAGGPCGPDNTAPEAVDVTFTGTPQTGQTLTGSYTFTDAENNTESGSVLAWQSSADNTFTAPSVAGTGATYTVVAADEGNWIRFCVIPSDGQMTGNQVCSAGQQVTAAPTSALLESESFASPGGNPTVGSFTGYDNAHLTFTGTADIRTSLASSGYTGASGGGNVMINANGEFLRIGGIDETESSNPLSLTMGIRKGTNAATGGELTIEYSTDNGTSWTDITYSSLPTGSGTASWHFVTVSTSIPNTVTDLRFIGTSGLEFRLDDINLD